MIEARPGIDPSTIPKLARHLVLGHLLERLVRDGVVHDYTHLARLVGLTKARVTQLVNLTLLAPDIQNEILTVGMMNARGEGRFERNLRHVAALADWGEQRAALKLSRG